MCKGGGQITGGAATTSNQQQNQNVAYTPYALGNFQDIYNRATQVASQPYTPYGGQLVAGLDPTQLAGVSQTGSYANAAQPWLTQAGAGLQNAQAVTQGAYPLIGTGAQFLAGAGQPISAGQIQNYMNPYQQSVIDTTLRNIQENNQQQQQGVLGNAAMRGALGGDRVGVAQAELARQQDLATNQTIAGLQAQNYQQATGTALSQQQAAMQAGQALGGLGATQAGLGSLLGNLSGQYGNLGLQSQMAGLQGAQALLGAGSIPQQNQQAQLTAQYQQYLQGLAFPYQQAQFLAGIGLPASGAQGGFQTQLGTTAQQLTPPGMTWGQAVAGGIPLVGGLLGGAGGISNLLGLGNTGGSSAGWGGNMSNLNPWSDTGSNFVPTYAGGGRAYPYVPHYAEGGDTDEHDDTPYEGIEHAMEQSAIPTVGQLSTGETQIHPSNTGSIIPPSISGGGGGGQQQQQQSSGGSDWLGSALKIGAQLLPFMLANRGGAVGYDDGGGIAYPTEEIHANPYSLSHIQGGIPRMQPLQRPDTNYGTLSQMRPAIDLARFAAGQEAISQEQARQLAESSGHAYRQIYNQASGGAIRGYDDGGDVDLPPTSEPTSGQFWKDIPPVAPDSILGQIRAKMVGQNVTNPPPVAATPQAISPTVPVDASHPTSDVLSPNTAYPTAGGFSLPRPVQPQTPPPIVARTAPREPSYTPYPTTADQGVDPGRASWADVMNLRSGMYDNATAQRQNPTQMLMSPRGLVELGARILAANPAHGVSGAIGQGVLGTMGTFDKFANEDLSAKEKAQQLATKIKEHVDRYTKMTPHEAGTLAIARARLAQERYTPVNVQDNDGNVTMGFADLKHHRIVDQEGNPLSGKIMRREAAPREYSDKDLDAAIMKANPTKINWGPEELATERARWRAALGKVSGAQGMPLGSPDNPIPYVEGQTIPEKGKYYRKDGKIVPWN